MEEIEKYFSKRDNKKRKRSRIPGDRLRSKVRVISRAEGISIFTDKINKEGTRRIRLPQTWKA